MEATWLVDPRERWEEIYREFPIDRLERESRALEAYVEGEFDLVFDRLYAQGRYSVSRYSVIGFAGEEVKWPSTPEGAVARVRYDQPSGEARYYVAPVDEYPDLYRAKARLEWVEDETRQRKRSLADAGATDR